MSKATTVNNSAPVFVRDGDKVTVSMRGVHVATLTVDGDAIAAVDTTPEQWQAFLDVAGFTPTGPYSATVVSLPTYGPAARASFDVASLLHGSDGKVAGVMSLPRYWDGLQQKWTRG